MNVKKGKHNIFSTFTFHFAFSLVNIHIFYVFVKQTHTLSYFTLSASLEKQENRTHQGERGRERRRRGEDRKAKEGAR